MNVFDRTGKMALGSRLRVLTAKFTDDGAGIYGLYDIKLVPKWFPVFFVLSEDGEKTVTAIASEIGHSQPSVTKIIKEMAAAGLVKDNLKAKDKRKNLVGLTPAGEALNAKMKELYLDVEGAVGNIISEATYDLWEAVKEWEFLLEQKSLLRRVQEQKKARESKDIRIVPYEPQYKAAFRSLNEEWISRYFEMEESDYRTLDNPEEDILSKGGKIFVALYQDRPVGVCALKKAGNAHYDYEMVKMAVAPEARGKSIGLLLGNAIINAARELGASKIYLEGNTILKASIGLYQKLGFRKIAGYPSSYKRVNIHMELEL
ncbi:MAG: MarR family transcriptional regulator [Cytophagaceae bacterium SCN 52-12]|nr:MAG: MarR family transcriptional regulator [Cytophagaceae bacterium SCN 52-12]